MAGDQDYPVTEDDELAVLFHGFWKPFSTGDKILSPKFKSRFETKDHKKGASECAEETIKPKKGTGDGKGASEWAKETSKRQ